MHVHIKLYNCFFYSYHATASLIYVASTGIENCTSTTMPHVFTYSYMYSIVVFVGFQLADHTFAETFHAQVSRERIWEHPPR